MEYVQQILREHYRPINADRRSVTNLYNDKYLYETKFWEDWVVHEDENSSRNRWTLDAALRFRCMDRDNVTVVDAFDMADRVIAFLSGGDDTYETTGTATQSKRRNNIHRAARQYGRKGKQLRMKP
ncbi:hypothetical protein Scep_022599 [Stephania cephalantha]|uniref:Uncharacterized protein n=1 Tax=Stephania cephalantha TaxID=152367 RepID=A0AAP0F8A3_9MAGN